MDVSALTSHKIFQNLRDRFPSKSSKCLELMDCEQDFLFLWDSQESSIRCANVKHCLRDNDLESEILLTPSIGLSFEVERLKANPTCSFICLSGVNGVAVVNLPDSMPQTERLYVPLRSLSERLYLGELHECVKAKWFPGSPTDTHLVTLSSDECLRCYDVRTGSIIWKCHLSKRSICPSHGTLPSKVSIADRAVDFDFAPSVIDEEGEQWPVLILWGNGDVFCAWTNLSHEKAFITGPLRMFPPSDDNYGYDASSILVTGYCPPLVVLATSTATMYHCLLVSSEEPVSRLDKSLLVVESVELDIGFNISGQDEMPTVTPIMLYKDPVDVVRYFCVHLAGVHSVTVPLVSKLHSIENENEENYEIPPYREESMVDYLLCTNISGSTNATLVESLSPLGCSLINLSRNFFVLLQDELCNIRLVPRILYSMTPQDVNKDINNSLAPEGFVLLVDRALRENSASGCPLMKLGPGTQPREWFEVFSRTITYLYSVTREHKSIALQLDAKASALKVSVAALKNGIDALLKEKAELKETAEHIAESYEELNDRQTALMKNLENLILSTYSKKPGLTSREKSALDKLISIEKSLETYERDMERLKSNINYYKTVSKDKDDSVMSKNTYIDESRAKVVRKQLSSLMSDIGDLTRRVKIMKLSIDQSGTPDKH